MRSELTLLGVAIVLFASTNIDDGFVLAGLFADRRFRAWNIVIGQYAGLALLFVVSAAASLLSFVIPTGYLGLLGIAPILIGAKRLYELRGQQDPSQEAIKGCTHGYNRTATVAVITIANGGDNIGIYAPSFARRSGSELATIALVFVVLTAVWCIAAKWVVRHPSLGKPIRRYAHVVTPVIFVGLGVWILYGPGSFALFHL